MAQDRTTLRSAAIPRRPPAAPAIQRSPVAVAPSPAQVLQQRLGNQGTQALLARTSLLAPSSRVQSSPVSAGTAPATPTAGPTAVVSPAPVPPTPPPAVKAALPAPGQSRDQTVTSDTPETPAVKTAPKSSKDDPAFQKVIQQTRRTKEGLKKNKGPEVKKQELKDASHLPVQDQTDYNDRKQHLETINQTAASNKDAKQVFTAKQFKALLETHLQELETKLPHSEADAARFKREKPLEKIKSDVSQEVTEQNQKVAAPITAETQKAEPPKSEIETTVPKDLVEEKPGPTPKSINPAAAAPKPLQDSEISLEKESKSLDELMAKNNNTEEQFAESNEPKFKKALSTKKEAQEKAAAAPQQYRGQEKRILAGAQKGALQHGGTAFGSMFQTRGAAFGEVNTKQSQTNKDDKSEQARVKTELERIYSGTKTDVETIFTELSTYVDETFNTESTAAKTAFEERVEEQLDDIHGWGISDAIFGEDTEEIEAVFVAEKQRFLSAMDTTLNTIAQRIADDLNKAVARIQAGKDEAERFYKGLDKEQQRLSGEAMETFRVQFANLESSVDEKQTELAHSLAESYKQNRDSLRATFVKINEECRKTWIQKAAEFIKEIAMTIYRLGELLVTVLVRIAGLIGDILAHPIRFLENLAAGIKQGFKTFADNFDTYLIAGFFEWLRGKVGGAGIKMPAKLDTAGLFSLALQVIGLTYDNFRRIAAQKLGEPVVAAIEKGVEGAQEVYKLLQMAREDIGAFWSHIKAMLANSVDEIFEKIKKTVLYETIKKVLAYIVTLFNPVGAFIKAAQAIYAGIRFLMDNIDRIVALVNAFLDGVEMAVKGNVAGIAAKVIFGLQNAIVMGIDFLAKLLGLGNLADKVRAIIKQLSTPVERAMGFVVDKVLKPVVGMMTKAGKSVVQAGKSVVQAGLPKDPVERAKRGMETAESAVNKFAGKKVGKVVLTPLLAAIKVRYGFTTLQVFPSGTDWWIEGAMSPIVKRPTKAKVGEGAAQGEMTIERSTTTLAGDTVGKSMTVDWLGPKVKAGTPPESGVQDKLMGLLVTDPKNRSAFKFIRGHLLNEHLGGRGNAENMFPITANANSQHLHSTETRVKSWLNKPDRWIWYQVKVTGINKNLDVTKEKSPENWVDSTFECNAKLKDETGKVEEDFSTSIPSVYEEKGQAVKTENPPGKR